MDNSKKLKLSDLKPKVQDNVDWQSLDEFFNVDGPNLLNKPLMLIKMIQDNNLTEVPEIKKEVIVNYATGMTNDTQKLSIQFKELRDRFIDIKNKSVSAYNEDIHMWCINMAHEMTVWLENYENTVDVNFNNLINYINDNTDVTNQLILN